MLPASTEFAASLTNPMGCYYLFAAMANLAAMRVSWRQGNRIKSIAWMFVGLGFSVLGIMAFRGHPLQLADGLKVAIDAVCSPSVLNISFFASFLIIYIARDFFARPAVAWAFFTGALLLFGASLTDQNFYAAVLRPDDVPIVAMVFLLGFFLWLALHQAVENDPRLAVGRSTIEKDYAEKVLVWPDLVYSEMICMIALSAVLIVWSLLLPAPLEQPANPAVTPNPSKAPWYFVGLQELLTYFDAWNVGVLVPLLAILGMAAIPYLDRNPAGSGYYSLRGRRFAILVFLFGFLQLWILPILIGTFLRGPNWSFFGLFEARDPSKMLTVGHLSLAEVFWNRLLHRPLPQTPPDAGAFLQFLSFLYRDLPGVSLTLLYFIAVPILVGRTLMKRSRQSLGFVRFHLMMFLLLYMLTLPIKMMLHWIFGLDSFFG